MSNQTTGVLGTSRRGDGFLRNPANSLKASPEDAYVSQQLVKKYGLVLGATVTGPTRPGKKSPELVDVDSICGLTPEEYRNRTPFTRLLAINPEDRFDLGAGGNPSMRIVDLVAPIARGTRGLIVAPPKTGKTQLLEELAKGIKVGSPDAHIIILLINERPEEVTHFRRQVPAEVYASSADQPNESHVRMSEFCMGQVRCEVECGRDVIVLVDSITRMGRAYNQLGTGSKRTLSGGLGADALEAPRRFFGLARNIEGGGSATVIATALIETGSRMDDLIFEEFKGTGNSELVLDRSLAESRVFPAINVRSSGTRRDDLIYNEEELLAVNFLRRGAIDVSPRAGVEGLLNLLQKYPTNELLLKGVRS